MSEPPPGPPPPPGGPPPPPPPPSGGPGGGGAEWGPGPGGPGGPGRLDLGAAFRFGWETFQANLSSLVVAVVVYFVLVFAVGLAWQLLVGGLFGDADTATVSGAGLFTGLVVSALGSLVFTVGQYIVQAVIIRAGFDLVDGRGLDTSRLFDTNNLGAIVVTGLLVSLGTLVGFVLCILPGIIFAVVAGYSFHFVIDEGMSPTEAIRASVELYRDEPGSALLLWITTAIVSGLGLLLCGVGIVVTFPVALIAQAHGFRQLRGRAPRVA